MTIVKAWPKKGFSLMSTDPYLSAISNAAAELDKTVDDFAAWVTEEQKEYDILFGTRCWCGGFSPCAMHPKESE